MELTTIDIVGTINKLFWDIVKLIALCGALAFLAAAAPLILFVLPQVLILRNPDGDFSGMTLLFAWLTPLSVALWMAFLCNWHSRRLWQRAGKTMSEWREAHDDLSSKPTKLTFLGLFGSFACEALFNAVFKLVPYGIFVRRDVLWFALFPFAAYTPVILLLLKRRNYNES